MTERLHRVSARRLLLLAALGSVAATAAMTSDANAAFTLTKCGGSDIAGRGASFARDAHIAWRTPFRTLFCSGSPDVTYDPAGSGAGRRTLGERSGGACPAGNNEGCNSRNRPERFAGTDEAPKPAGVTQINQGTGTASDGDEGQVHVIPAAVGSVAILVNFPNNCDRTLLNDANETDPTATNFTNRVRFTKAQLEAIFWGDASNDNWTEVFTELAPDADCNVPIKRVVRFDDSGTTFALKDYLNTINPGRPHGWLSSSYDGLNNRWPNTVGADDPGTNAVVNGGSNGNGPLVAALQATDGSIGYSDISTARTAGLAITSTNIAGNRDDDQFWTQVQNGSNVYTEPTSDTAGFRTDGLKGANCANTTFTGVPANTFGNWVPTSGVNSPAGYGICTLTYLMAFDDNATAYGNTPAEEAKARTVKDYFDFIVSDGGQGQLAPADYAPLPPAILAISRAGVAKFGWNKAGVGQNTGDTGPPPGGNNPPGTNPPPPDPPIVRPSNVFSIPSSSVKKNVITINLRVPGAGRLRGVAKAKTKKIGKTKAKNITVGSATLNPTAAGTYKLTIKPSKATLAALKKQKKMTVKVAVTFTPTGGDAKTVNRTVTLKK